MALVPLVPPARLEDVARVLSLVARMPGRSEKPRPGDLEGAFDVWFDGGACRFVTDYNEYCLADGAMAWLSTSSPRLSGAVRLATGETVTFSQQPPAADAAGEAPGSGLPGARAAAAEAVGAACVVCGSEIGPAETATLTPRGPAHLRCV